MNSFVSPLGQILAILLRRDRCMGESLPTSSVTEIESVVTSLRRLTKRERSIARKRLTVFSVGRLPLLERQYVEKGLESCAFELIARSVVAFAGVFCLIGFVLVFTKGHSSSLLGVEIAFFILSFFTILCSLSRLRQGISAGRRFAVSRNRNW